MAYSDGSTPAAIAPLPGLLIGVTDSFGRALGFRYNAASQLIAMTDPAGGVFAYAYDLAGNLAGVTYPDSKLRTYVYNEPGNTSGTSQPSALTGIIDENGARFSTYKYDATGRAIFSGLTNGANNTTLSYTSGTSTSVTDALGQTRTYQFSTSHGVQRVRSISSVCRDCGLPASRTYDANGNVATRTEFNGNVTSYSFDLRAQPADLTHGGGRFAARQDDRDELASDLPVPGQRWWRPTARLHSRMSPVAMS